MAPHDRRHFDKAGFPFGEASGAGLKTGSGNSTAIQVYIFGTMQCFQIEIGRATQYMRITG
jgi:hypothetical protein